MRSHWARRSLKLVAAVALLIIVWRVAIGKDYAASFAGYSLVDSRTLVVEAVAGHESWCRIGGVTESSAEVQVSAICLDWLSLPGTADGVFYALTIQLAAPLGNRRVVDCSSGSCLTVPAMAVPAS
jgi:hypothetical protein